MRILLIWMLMALPSWGEGEKAGEFDYFVLSLSWSPNWCAYEGDARDSDQCDARHDHGWIMHGLWPQFHRGFPSYCRTSERAPSRGMTADMADIMGTSGLAWHQWNKHGTCAGMSAREYYETSRQAYDGVTRPNVFRRLKNAVELPARVVEDAFLQENPNLSPNMLTVTCRADHIQEVRICLTKDLYPRECGADVARDCSLEDAYFAPIR